MMRLPLLLGALAAAAPAASVPLAPATHAAVVAAVRARMGADADVQVQALGAPVPPVAAVADAVLEPGAALGAPLRVALRASVDRGGAKVLAPVAHVSVTIEVTVDQWHTTRAVPRGARLGDGDLTRVRHRLTRGALRPFPVEDEVREARVVQDLPADACLTTRVVAPTPAVTAGADVVGIVREGRMEARAQLVAVDSGRIGDLVRVMHPESRRTFRARVTARAEVEIRHDR
jgi:flagella basal body P-ring formation protein FlgA